MASRAPLAAHLSWAVSPFTYISTVPHSTSPPPLKTEIYSSRSVEGDDSDTGVSICVYHETRSTASYLNSKFLPRHECLLRGSGCPQLALKRLAAEGTCHLPGGAEWWVARHREKRAGAAEAALVHAGGRCKCWMMEVWYSTCFARSG